MAQFTECFSRSCPRTKVGSNKDYTGSTNESDRCGSFFLPAKFTFFCEAFFRCYFPLFCHITSGTLLEKFCSMANNLLYVTVVI